MSSYGDEPLAYEFMSDTDGDMQLIARDPAANWVVIEQRGDGPPEVLTQHHADGELAYYRGLLSNPAWYISRGAGRILYVFAEGRRFPKLFGQPGALDRTFLTDTTEVCLTLPQRCSGKRPKSWGAPGAVLAVVL